jgi:aspartyl-tRNA(Asn)/glutamyl-tRNA(Gln) amidotransferase subunit B
VAEYEAGGTVVQETRLYDPAKGETRPMRAKEFAHDYRYFPDPDLLPLTLTRDYVDRIRAAMPELPDQKQRRFMAEYGLAAADAALMAADRETAAYFEQVATGRDGRAAASWVGGSLFALLNRKGLGIAQSPIAADGLGKLLDRIADGTISARIGKEVFEIMGESGEDADAIIAASGLRQVSDTDTIAAAIARIVAANPKQVAQFKAGNDKVVGWFVGQVMKETGGKANPQKTSELVRQKLAE